MSNALTQAHHDAPSPERPHRVYVAVTNNCNRACPWCSVYSRPGLQSAISIAQLKDLLNRPAPFELQLEGGEPTLHPEFWSFVDAARQTRACTRLILSTNGVLIPRDARARREWLDRLGTPLTIKLSVNHHLIERDAAHVQRAGALYRDVLRSQDEGNDVELVINLRRRAVPDDLWVREQVEAAGLLVCTNDFTLQRYGLASDQPELAPPYLAGTNFSLVNPDGSDWGTDLIARSEAMGALP